MNQLEALGIFLIEVYACNAGVVNLFEEFPEVCATFMVNPGIGKETARITALEYADTEINVFTETHAGEATQLLIDLSPHTHIETAGIKLI